LDVRKGDALASGPVPHGLGDELWAVVHA
jgi:hypothetical protein